MLSFDAALTNRLASANTECFFGLKLYYNDDTSASNFIGISDKYILDGSDEYHGIVKSWGSLTQSINFFSFTSQTFSFSLNLINAENTIQNGRFSDLLSTYNFANRKWELFLCANKLDTIDTSSRMIATGVITGFTEYDMERITVRLDDLHTARNLPLPRTTVTETAYPDAPKDNIGSPIPMAYGDFYEKDDIGTIPSEFSRYYPFYKGAVPAIITNKRDATADVGEARVDTETMHTLDNENIYVAKNKTYVSLTDGSNDATTNNPVIQFDSRDAKVYIPLTQNFNRTVGTSGNLLNPGYMTDGEFDTYTSFKVDGSNQITTAYFGVPEIQSFGQYIGVKCLTKVGSYIGSWSNGTETLTLFEQAQLSVSENVVIADPCDSALPDPDNWDFGDAVFYKLQTTSTSKDVGIEIDESGMEIQFYVDGYESWFTTESRTVTDKSDTASMFAHAVSGGAYPKPTKTIYNTIHHSKITPASLEYIYVSGKGRKFTSGLTSGRSNGYATSDFIENPVYIIEDILRREMSLTGTEIDTDTFDTAGHKTTGVIKDLFDVSLPTDVKFAFSQNVFIDSFALLNRMSKQILSWNFISGNGKYKLKSLKRPSDYSASDVDKIVDYTDVDLDNIRLSPLDNVRNKISAKYNYQFAGDHYLSETTAEEDSTSQGNTVNGVNESLEMVIETDILDSDTATKMCNAYLACFKDRKSILSFSLPSAYLALEVCDIVSFKDWDSNIKIYGDAMATDDYYMITKISKKPTGCSVEAIKVSE